MWNMKIISFKEEIGLNSNILARNKNEVIFNRIKVTCSSYYSIYINKELIDFGPVRSSKNLYRSKLIDVPISSNVEISILYYGFPSFDIENQPFFFGIELYKDDELVSSSFDFDYFINKKYLSISSKYSYQRGLIERYDLSSDELIRLNPKEVTYLKEIEIIKANNKFPLYDFSFIRKEDFKGFSNILPRPYLDFDNLRYLNNYDLELNFFSKIKEGYKSYLYKLDGIKSGLFKIHIKSKSKGKIFLVFDELVEDGKWVFGRSNCNDFIEINVNKGTYELINNIPYCLQYLMVLVPNDDIEVDVSFIGIENNIKKRQIDINDKDLLLIYEASKNTYIQNSYDLFTDCPGRERAPWLCDSYFLGLAEYHFSSSNKIEKRFLTNYLYQDCLDIPNDVFAMCYPSDHKDGTFIPNWGMWLVIELLSYRNRSRDEELIKAFKDKVYSFYYFLKQYETPDGLLSNLPSWVFIEWSKANDFTKGINFPTNMLYMEMIRDIGILYEDEELIKKSIILMEKINELSYFDGFYHDHAYIDKGKINVYKEDISETCQYYALFFNLNEDREYVDKIKFHVHEYNLLPSALFIGKYLRMLFLLREKEFDLLKNEIKSNFLEMANSSKTIWEKLSPTASCNHGFASSLAYIIEQIVINDK